MHLSDRIELLTNLGDYLARNDERVQAHLHRASVDNPWFTPEFLSYAIGQITGQLRVRSALEQWTAGLDDVPQVRRVGMIMAGNIPLVGFHDLLCVFIAGHTSVIKLSDKDKYLIPFLIKVLGEMDPRAAERFEIVDKLSDFDAVIATGSNNSARYFEHYFGKYRHIIRRNRNAVAILDGDESDEMLDALCDDVFLYFGMGCRNVSHVFVPEGYDFGRWIKKSERYQHLAQHNKYRNNLDYNLALLILNKTPHIALQHLVLVESPQWISPVSTLYYSYYRDQNTLLQQLREKASDIQCVVTRRPAEGLRTVQFGKAQQPAIDEYADGVNTLEFLKTLSA